MTMTTFTGKEYLMIDVANNFGLDKEDWSVRLDWFKSNEANLESLIKQADEPAMYYASVKAFRMACRGEVVHHPISLDATSSGLQILACLTGDRKAASICNVINSGKREDAYQVVYKHMLSKLGGKATLAKKDVKQAVMTALYGSEAVPREVFGEASPQLAQFYHSMEELAPAAWELNSFFLKIWDPEAYINSWTLPDNFHVHVKVMASTQKEVEFLGKKYLVTYEENRPTEEGRSLGANVTHSVDGMIVREMGRRCDYNPLRIDIVRQALKGQVSDMDNTSEKDDDMVDLLWGLYQDSGFLSARILDHLGYKNLHKVDADVIQELLNSMPKKPFQVLSIHDCFRCLANYGNDLRIQYANLLMLIAKSDMLSHILSQIMGQHVPVTKYDHDMWKDIKDSDYAIC